MAKSSETIISLKGVGKIYRDGQGSAAALRDVNLDVPRGDFLCISGPSGSGKSTLLSIMGCLLSPTGGDVIFDGDNVARLPEKERASIRSEKIGFVFQDSVLFENLRVWENVALPLLLLNRGKGARESAAAKLAQAGLSDKFNSFPSALSAGQRKRVELARALVTDAQVILADEPTSGLDRAAGEHIMDILSREASEQGRTVVFVTHDPHFAQRAHRLLELIDGRLV